MKSVSTLLFAAAFSCCLPLTTQAETPKGDPFEEGMRAAFADYKKGDNEAVTAKLRELIKLMEDKGAAKVGQVLPDQIGNWKGESIKRDDIGILGGGVSLSRNYVLGKKQITAKVVKDSPLVKQLIPLLANDELIRLSNRKTYHIDGGTAIMDGTKKLQMVVDQRILVELTTDDDNLETELVALARKLDLNALAKMK